MKLLHFALLAICMMAGCEQPNRDASQPKTSQEINGEVGRDNTAVNKRDRSEMEKTPFDQNENQADINITANIRKSTVDSKMSVNAHNIKIITQNGIVTLRGPVESADEKKQIEEIARTTPGVKSVDSQLEVK